jgi:hypothetical protein
MRSSETSMNLYRTRPYSPGDSSVRSHSCEDVNSTKSTMVRHSLAFLAFLNIFMWQSSNHGDTQSETQHHQQMYEMIDFCFLRLYTFYFCFFDRPGATDELDLPLSSSWVYANGSRNSYNFMPYRLFGQSSGKPFCFRILRLLRLPQWLCSSANLAFG